MIHSNANIDNKYGKKALKDLILSIERGEFVLDISTEQVEHIYALSNTLIRWEDMVCVPKYNSYINKQARNKYAHDLLLVSHVNNTNSTHNTQNTQNYSDNLHASKNNVFTKKEILFIKFRLAFHLMSITLDISLYKFWNRLLGIYIYVFRMMYEYLYVHL